MLRSRQRADERGIPQRRALRRLPPTPVRVRGGGTDPTIHLRREEIFHHVAVAEEHVLETLPFVIMPDAAGIDDAAVRVPGPIALDDLVDRASGDGGRFDRRGVHGTGSGGGVAGDVLHAEGLGGPLDQVAIAPTIPGGLRLGIEGVPVIGRAMEGIDVAHVGVQRSPVLGDEGAVIQRVTLREVGLFAADGRPALLHRVVFEIVIDVEVVANADLVLIAGALDLERLGFRARDRRQQHRRQDRDDRDDHQQFDEGEPGRENASVCSPRQSGSGTDSFDDRHTAWAAGEATHRSDLWLGGGVARSVRDRCGYPSSLAPSHQAKSLARYCRLSHRPSSRMTWKHFSTVCLPVYYATTVGRSDLIASAFGEQFGENLAKKVTPSRSRFGPPRPFRPLSGAGLV